MVGAEFLWKKKKNHFIIFIYK